MAPYPGMSYYEVCKGTLFFLGGASERLKQEIVDKLISPPPFFVIGNTFKIGVPADNIEENYWDLGTTHMFSMGAGIRGRDLLDEERGL